MYPMRELCKRRADQRRYAQQIDAHDLVGYILRSAILQMSPSQSVLAFLKEHVGIGYCDDCLRNILHIARVRMNERHITRIVADLGLNRQSGRCSVCHVARMVTKWL